MFGMMSNPRAAYVRVGIDMRVETADPHQLIVLLFQGARLAVSAASEHHKQGNLMEMSRSISNAIDIIAQGLKASLDYEAGGDLAQQLAALYDYACSRLQSANLRGNEAIFEEVNRLLSELQGAWEEIGKDQPAVPPSRVAA